MKKVILFASVLGAAACHRAAAPAPAPAPAPSAGQPTTSASTASATLKTFVNAAKAQDIQTMSNVWGNKEGAARERMPWDEVQKRVLTMMCYLKHDSYEVRSERLVADGGRVINVQFKLGDLTRTSEFTAVPGPGGKWFVEKFELEPLQALCAKK